MAITTAEELLRAGDIGRCELVRGELRRMIPPSYEHGSVAYEIGFRLGEYVRPRHLGRVVAAETGFLISRGPDTVRAPDVGFVRAERATGPPRGYYPGAPDLAVEVLSPEDRSGEVREKVAEWLGAGARAVWVVDPEERALVVHEPGRTPVVLREGDILRGGDAVPGFEFPVRDVFDR